MIGIHKATNQIEMLIQKVGRYPIVYILLAVLITDIFISCIFSYILFPDHSSGLKFTSITEEVFLLVVFGPVLETLIFQSFIIKKSLQYFNNDKLIAILISAIAFGISHYYSIPYVIKATLAGTLYSLLYFIIKSRNTAPFIFILLVHSTYNLIGLILNHL